MCTEKSGHTILLPEKLLMPRKRYRAEFKKEAAALMTVRCIVLCTAQA